AFLHDTRAAAAVEMALVLPFLAYILINVADLSVYVFDRMQVDLAAQEAVGTARYVCDTAAELPATTNCGGTLNTKMLAAARSTSLGNSVSLNTPTEAWFCSTAGGANLTQVAAITAARPANCSATIAGSTAKPGDYISITASRSFTSLFPGASIAASLPATITSTAWLRLQ
ncbi:MAG: TadE family protein, partial [Novosphingobium sp.]